MNSPVDNSAYDELCEKINALSEHQESPEFKSALVRLEEYAETGSVDAAKFLAEMLAYDGCCHDAAKAYRWYFVALSSQGYSTGFNDQNGTPPNYCGPVGDFRNESMVSDLVAELGFEKVLALDLDVTQWLSRRSI
jgi:hypothetical protein